MRVCRWQDRDHGEKKHASMFTDLMVAKANKWKINIYLHVSFSTYIRLTVHVALIYDPWTKLSSFHSIKCLTIWIRSGGFCPCYASPLAAHLDPFHLLLLSAGREKLTCMPQQKSKNCKWIWLEEGVEEWAKKSVIGEEMLNCLYIITSN